MSTLIAATPSERQKLMKVLGMVPEKRLTARKAKYKNKITYIGALKFHSQKEARRYVELKLLEDAGKIKALELQPKYELRAYPQHIHDGPVKIGSYVADFRYFDASGKQIVEDVKSKGTVTAIYRLKKKMMLANYGVAIHEVF